MNIFGNVNVNYNGSGYESNMDLLKEPGQRAAYKANRKALNNILSNAKPVSDFSFVNYGNIGTLVDIDYALEQAKAMKNILENTGGNIFVLDLETTGKFGPDATDFEKNIASITEVAFQRQRVRKGVKGNMIAGDLEDAGSLLFGITKENEWYYRELIRKVKHQSYSSLTDAEKSTFKRLTVYSGLFEDRFETIKKGNDTIFSLKKLASADPTSIAAAEEGLDNLLTVGQWQGFGSTRSITQLRTLRDMLDTMNKRGDVLETFNGAKYDIPFLNEVFSKFGIEPIQINKHFDLMNSLNAAAYGDVPLIQQTIRDELKIDKKLGRSPGSLEAWADTLGVKISAHQGTSDTRATHGVATATFPGTDKKVYDFIIDQLEGIKNDPMNKILNGTGKNTNVIYANRSIRIDVNGFDYVTNRAGEVRDYLDYSLNRNNFYRMSEGVSFIQRNQLPEHIRKKMNSEAKGLYVMKLFNAASDSDDITILARENLSDFQALFQNDLSIHPVIESNNAINYNNMTVKELRKEASRLQVAGRSSMKKDDLVKALNVLQSNQDFTPDKLGAVTQEMIDKQYARNITDAARRDWDSMFQANTGKGFSLAERWYDTYDSLNEQYAAFISKADAKISKVDLQKLVKDGQLVFEGKTLKVEQALSGLNNKGGKLVKERVRNFVELYNVIGDTQGTMRTLLNRIKSNLPIDSNIYKLPERQQEAFVNAQRTMALRQAWGEVQETAANYYSLPGKGNLPMIATEEAKNVVSNKVAAPRLFGELNSVELFNTGVDGGTFRINASSVDSARNGIYRRLASIGKNEKLPSTRANLQMKALNQMADDLVARGLIDAKFAERLAKQSNPYHASFMLGKQLHTIVKDAHGQFTTEQLLDISRISEFIDKDSDRYKIAKRYEALIQNPVMVMDNEGFKIGGKSFDSFIDGKIDIGGAAANSTKNKPRFVLNSNSNIDDLKLWLKKDLGYSDSNIETFEDMLFHKTFGLANKENNRSVIFFEGVDHHGTNKPFMAITTHKNSLSVAEAIANGMSPTELMERNMAAVTDLNVIKSNKGVRVIPIGHVDKAIPQTLNIFAANNVLDEAGFVKAPGYNLVVNMIDLQDEALGGYRKTYQLFNELIDSGQFQRAGKMLHNSLNAPILSGPGLSGMQTVKMADGTMRKMVVPSVADLHVNNEVYIGKLANFIPILYEQEEDLRGQIDEYFSSAYDDSAYKTMLKWKEQMASGKWGSLKDFDDLTYEQQEWFIKNFLNGENLLERMVKHKDLLDPRTAATLENILKSNPSFITKEKNVYEAKLVLNNPIKKNVYGPISGISRPVQFQWQSNHAIFVDEIMDNAEVYSRLQEMGVTLGENVRSNDLKTGYLDVLRNANAERPLNIETGITGHLRQMSGEEVFLALENTQKNKDKILAELGGKYTSEQFDEVLGQFMAISDTNEQLSVLNPFLKRHVFNKPEMYTFRVDEGFKLNEDIAMGSVVKKGQVIGTRMIDGVEENVIYTKDTGILSFMDETTMFFEPESPQINAVKLGISGSEKTVGVTVNVEEALDDLATAIYGDAFGKDTALVGHFELGKSSHASGSVIAGHYINSIAESISKYGVDSVDLNDPDAAAKLEALKIQRANAEKELLDYMNKHEILKQWNPNFVTDELTGNRILQFDEIASEGGNLQAILDLTNHYKGKKDAVSKFIYSNLQAQNDANTYVVHMRKMIMSEIHSAQGAEDEIGKGYKHDMRSRQVFGLQLGDEAAAFREWTDGGFEKWAEPILQYRDELVQSSPEYKRALDQLGNIYTTVVAAKGDDVNAIVKDININDINVPRGGVRAEDLYDTVFSDIATTEDGLRINAYRVDLNGIEVYNPITKKMESQLYIPQVITQQHEGMVYLTETQKKVADLLSDAKRLSEDLKGYKGPLTLDEYKTLVNKKYEDMFLAFEFEMNNKKGLMHSKLLSGRIPFSGQALGAKIQSPVFRDKEGNILRTADEIQSAIEEGREFDLLNTHTGKDVVKVESGKLKLYDIVETSEEQLKAMGGDTIFEDIGHQMVEERYRGDKEFMDSLVSKGLIHEDGSLNLDHVVRKEIAEPEYPAILSKEELKVAQDAIPKPDIVPPDYIGYNPTKMPEAPVKPKWSDVNVKLKQSFSDPREAMETLRSAQLNEFNRMQEQYLADLDTYEKQIADIYEKNRRHRIEIEKANKVAEKVAKQTSDDKYLAYMYQQEELFRKNLDNIKLKKEMTREYKTALEAAEEAYLSARENAKKAIKEQIGKAYATERGIFGSFLRYPTFLTTSQIAANFRLNEELQGRVFVFQGHTAIKLNADNDGDKETAILNLKKRKDERIVLWDENDIKEINTRKMYEKQAELNAGTPLEKAIENYTLSADKTAKRNVKEVAGDLERYMSYLEMEFGEGFLNHDNFIKNDLIAQQAVKSKFNKIAIGYVSTPNYVLRDVAASVFKTDIEGQRHFENILELTDLSEQKLIDVKHGSGEVKKVSYGPKYKKALTQMASGDEKNLRSGLELMTDVLYNAGMYKDLPAEMVSVDDIINGTADLNVAPNRALNSLYTLFKDPQASAIWNSPLERNQAGKKAADVISGLVDALTENNIPSSEINDMKIRQIRRASNVRLLNLDGDIVTNKNVLYSTGGEGAPSAGAYKLVDLGIGSQSQQSYAKLKNIDTGEEHYIYGGRFEDVGEKMSERFRLAAGNTEEEMLENVVQKYTDNIVDASLENHSAFKTKAIEAQVIHTLSQEGISDKIDLASKRIDDILMQHDIPGGSKDSLKSHLLDLNASVTSRQREAYSKAYTGFFNTQLGNEVEEFTGVADVLVNKNYHTSSGELIRQFNEKIRQEGAVAKDIRDEMITSTVTGPISSKQAVISDITKRAGELKYGFQSDAAARNTGISDVIAEINNTKVYDLNKVRGQLQSNLEKQMPNIEESLIAQYGREGALELAKERLVDQPLANFKEYNEAATIRLSSHYAALADNGSEEAMKFLNWNSKEAVSSYMDVMSNSSIKKLGEAKIAFGDYVGASINELSIDALRELHGLSIDADLPAPLIKAMRGTQEQIGYYFEALDKMGSRVNSDILERRTSISGLQELSQKSIDRLSDINDAIREAGQEAAERGTTSAAERGIIQAAGEFFSRGGMKGKTIKGLAIAGAALGLASIVAGAQHTAPQSALTPERRPNGKGSPDVNGNYDSQPTVTPRLAPPSEKTVRAEGGSGVSYRVSGKSDGRVDLQSIISGVQQTIRRFTGPQLRVDVSTQNDTSQVSDSWLQEKFSELLR